ncbi:MAG: GTPase ObgE, partial [Deltaproteobacteria bacterium]
MKFIDEARIFVKAGDGGRGCVSFRREKYVPRGGPDGGDGGRGGDITLVADEGLSSLIHLQYQQHYRANRGGHGKGKDQHGRKGEELIITVPRGTLVKLSPGGEKLGELINNQQRLTVARGGQGGRGNPRFFSRTNRAPRQAEEGEKGEEKWLELELKLLADVGLIGFPSVGKSTLISRISAARPKIADYPFTTLIPNLGVVNYDEYKSFVIADVPGLIEGAHRGSGLGFQFLRHIERTRLLVHLLDISDQVQRDPVDDYEVINKELLSYNPDLLKKSQIIAVNKIDLPEARERLPR